MIGIYYSHLERLILYRVTNFLEMMIIKFNDDELSGEGVEIDKLIYSPPRLN